MTRHRALALGVLAGVGVIGLTGARAVTRYSGAPTIGSYAMRVAPLQLRSVGVMAFGSDATLYVADSRAGAVYAIDVAETGRDTSATGLLIKGIDEKVAAALKVSKDEIKIRDMVAHPLTQSVYLAVTKGRGETATPLIVRVTKRDKAIAVVPLEMIRHARVELPDAASRDTMMPWEPGPRSFTMTHLAVGERELYVAGLSNEEFKSTLRRVPLPFGERAVTTKVEIYHTSHDRFETAAPIESMVPVSLGARSAVLASYTCSPLVVFDAAALRGTGVVRGKTIAELGGGNRPFDMIAYKSPRDGKNYVMIANSHRTLMRLDLDAIAAAPAMTTPVKQAFQPGGLPYLPVSSYGVLELSKFNSKNIIVLQRSPADGSLELETIDLGWL
jgi:hypothetical protein